MRLRPLAAALLTTFALSGLAHADTPSAPKWEMFDEEDGIRMYRRDVPGSSIVARSGFAIRLACQSGCWLPPPDATTSQAFGLLVEFDDSFFHIDGNDRLEGAGDQSVQPFPAFQKRGSRGLTICLV